MALTAQEIADTLITAERERKGIAQFSDEHPDIPVEQLADWVVRLLLPGLRRFT